MSDPTAPLPLGEWVWVEHVRLACGCTKSSWVRVETPATAEDVMNRWGAAFSAPGHPSEHVEKCREHVGDPASPSWMLW